MGSFLASTNLESRHQATIWITDGLYSYNITWYGVSDVTTMSSSRRHAVPQPNLRVGTFNTGKYTDKLTPSTESIYIL